MKNYFVFIKEDERIDGPFNFREAERERNFWQRFGYTSSILKIVVDYEGNEVK